MGQVRTLEGNIASWQDQLRDRVHRGQLNNYRKEGENRVDQFCDKFDKEFQNLQNTKIERR